MRDAQDMPREPLVFQEGGTPQHLLGGVVMSAFIGVFALVLALTGPLDIWWNLLIMLVAGVLALAIINACYTQRTYTIVQDGTGVHVDSRSLRKTEAIHLTPDAIDHVAIEKQRHHVTRKRRNSYQDRFAIQIVGKRCWALVTLKTSEEAEALAAAVARALGERPIKRTDGPIIG